MQEEVGGINQSPGNVLLSCHFPELYHFCSDFDRIIVFLVEKMNDKSIFATGGRCANRLQITNSYLMQRA